MLERSSAQDRFKVSVIFTAAAIAGGEIVLRQRDPSLDIAMFLTVANMEGVPITPIIETIKERIQKLIKGV